MNGEKKTTRYLHMVHWIQCIYYVFYLKSGNNSIILRLNIELITFSLRSSKIIISAREYKVKQCQWKKKKICVFFLSIKPKLIFSNKIRLLWIRFFSLLFCSAFAPITLPLFLSLSLSLRCRSIATHNTCQIAISFKREIFCHA